MQNWSIVVRTAAAISALISGVTAIAGAVEWARGGSFSQAVELVVVWAGRVVYIVCIPLAVLAAIAGILAFEERVPPGPRRPVRLGLVVLAGLACLSLAVFASITFFRIAVVDDVGFWLKFTGAVLLTSGGVATLVSALVWTWSREPCHECPDCCSSVLVRARVCRHCGYRFAPPPTTPNPD